MFEPQLYFSIMILKIISFLLINMPNASSNIHLNKNLFSWYLQVTCFLLWENVESKKALGSSNDNQLTLMDGCRQLKTIGVESRERLVKHLGTRSWDKAAMVEPMKLLLVSLCPLAKDSHQGWLIGLGHLSTPHKQIRRVGRAKEGVPPKIGVRFNYNSWFTQTKGELG